MDVANQRVGPARKKDVVGDRVQKIFQDFLAEYMNDEGVPKYLQYVKDLSRPERNTLHVSFEDVTKYNCKLASTIEEEYYRVYPYLCRAVMSFMAEKTVYVADKELYVGFCSVPTKNKIRELKASKIGTLLRISGQVVRTHPVHPELVNGTFVCLDCQTVIKDVEQQFRYTLPTICRNEVCNNRTRFHLDVGKSCFVDFQRVRIQETQAELPRGSIPRSVEIILRAEAVEMAQPGDRVDFIGTLIVVPDVSQLSTPGVRAESSARHKGREGFETEGVRGLKALGVRELSYKTAFLAATVVPTEMKISAVEMLSASPSKKGDLLQKELTGHERQKIYDMSQDRNLYQNLMKSLFPTIHGNDEVKSGILLMLFGGVPKTTAEGSTLRGDINLCVVGDPSTAKSQFLKQVSEFTPRAVYTSGKASSAAGLTAAVAKDEESGMFVIEAGALMLADNGVCCIDEFDKMEVRDQVAIHEAMEQQTISITKAGVKATLNARTSILAAANPIGGRYDRTKSLKQNIALSAPIMSRFDLFFILVDECSEVTDYAIARRILDVHQNSEESISRVYTLDEIQEYITIARQFKPKITEDAQKSLVEHYLRLRMRDAAGVTKSSFRITVRQLESLVRLSEAMAKMYCSEEVYPKHVKEAFRLLNKSIIRVEQPDINLMDENEEDAMEVDEPEGEAATNNGGRRPSTPMPNRKPKRMQLSSPDSADKPSALMLNSNQISGTTPESQLKKTPLQLSSLKDKRITPKSQLKKTPLQLSSLKDKRITPKSQLKTTPLQAPIVTVQRATPKSQLKKTPSQSSGVKSKTTPTINRKQMNSTKKIHQQRLQDSSKKMVLKKNSRIPQKFGGIPFVPSITSTDMKTDFGFKKMQDYLTPGKRLPAVKFGKHNNSIVAKKIKGETKAPRLVTKENTPLPKKFDLKASLSRKLTYKPRKGPLKPLGQVNLNASVFASAPAPPPKIVAPENRVIKAKRVEIRGVLQGVRKNKRFELQMKNRKP